MEKYEQSYKDSRMFKKIEKALLLLFCVRYLLCVHLHVKIIKNPMRQLAHCPIQKLMLYNLQCATRHLPLAHYRLVYQSRYQSKRCVSHLNVSKLKQHSDTHEHRTDFVTKNSICLSKNLFFFSILFIFFLCLSFASLIYILCLGSQTTIIFLCLRRNK